MDPRFEAVQRDPRFAAPPKKKQASDAVKDDRFKGLLDDPDFSADVAKRTVDKRGRKVAGVQEEESLASPAPPGKGPKHALARKPRQKAKARGGKDAATARSAESAEAEAKLHATRWARARGLTSMPSSDDESDDDNDEGEEDKEKSKEREGFSGSDHDDDDHDDDDDDDDHDADDASVGSEEELSGDSADEPLTDEEEINEQDLIDEWGIGVMAANPEEKIPLAPEATSRLALVDLDWDVVRAVDILAALNSFKTKNGIVRRVTVYPSDYGLQRMAEEAANGPQALCPPKRKQQQSGATANGHDSTSEDEGRVQGDGHDNDGSSSDSGDEVDKLRIRMYEQSKLRYYYAVAECDSALTASALYDACDGAELGRGTGGGCKMDLRFVPQETSFEGRTVRDTATGVPFGYTPPTVFSAALQHTKPQLTWDADDVGRKKLLNRKMSEADLKDEDFRAYLASSSGDEDWGDEQQPTVYGNGAQGEGQAGAEHPKQGAKAARAQAAGSLRDHYRSLLLGSSGPKEEEDSEEEDKQGQRGKKKGKGKDVGGDKQGRSNKNVKAWGAADQEGESSEEGNEGEQGAAAAAKSTAARKGTKDKGNQGLEMEVTFVPGLEGLKQRIKERQKSKDSKQAETVWETYLRRKKEKAKMRKHKSRGGDSSDSSEDEPLPAPKSKGAKSKGSKAQAEVPEAAGEDEGDDMDPFDDPFFDDGSAGDVMLSGSDDDEQPKRKSKQVSGKGKLEGSDNKGGRQKKGGEPVDAKEAAELELLLLDDEKLRAGKLRRESKQAEQQDAATGKGKKSQRRKAKRTTNSGDEAAEDGAALAAANFRPNLADPRFADMMTNQHFALDPTDPRFRSGGGSAVFAKQLSEARALQHKHKAAGQTDQQQQQQVASMQGGAAGGAIHQSNGFDAGRKEQLELKSMVAHLKRKQQQVQNAGCGQDGLKKRPREEGMSLGTARKKSSIS